MGSPTFGVYVESILGEISPSAKGGDSPFVAAMRLIDESIRSDGATRFRFTIPHGPTIRVEAEKGRDQ